MIGGALGSAVVLAGAIVGAFVYVRSRSAREKEKKGKERDRHLPEQITTVEIHRSFELESMDMMDRQDGNNNAANSNGNLNNSNNGTANSVTKNEAPSTGLALGMDNEGSSEGIATLRRRERQEGEAREESPSRYMRYSLEGGSEVSK